MEESTSTNHDIVDVITGQYTKTMEPLTSDQCARLIFEAIGLIKRQLRYVGHFKQLPPMTPHIETLPTYSWFRKLAEYRESLIKKGIDKQFGLSNRVIEICSLQTDPPGTVIFFRVFLTQKGQLRIVKEWRSWEWPEGREDHKMEVLQVKNPEQLSTFLDTKSLILDDYGDFRRRHQMHGNLGLWILDGLMKIIESQEAQMIDRLKPFTQSRQTLSKWLDNAKSSYTR